MSSYGSHIEKTLTYINREKQIWETEKLEPEHVWCLSLKIIVIIKTVNFLALSC